MRKLLVFFILSFIAAYAFIHISFKTLSDDYYASMAYETEIMHESVKERFDLYLNSSHIVGVMAANVFSNHEVFKEEYEDLGKQVTEKFHEILGFNLLDADGKIIKVFPPSKNEDAFFKVTQNLPQIQASVLKGSSYWFSPPFELFQGEVGFAFYVPIYRRGIFIGWIVPVLSNKLFFERFRSTKFLEKYHLVVEDVTSGKNYFATSPLPAVSKGKFLQNRDVIFGREVHFYSWPVHPGFDFKLPWYICFLLSLVISSLATFAFRLFGQKKETKDQLDRIKALIDFTAKEASSSLMGIYKELNLMGKETGYVSTDKVSKYVSYISNLLDQISVSEKISHPGMMLEFQQNQIYPLLQEQIELFQNKLNDKKLVVDIDESPLFNQFEVRSNKWLLCHSVLGNIMRNIVYYATPASSIKVTFLQDENYKMISFYHPQEEKTVRDILQDEILDRCLSIAREVAKISNGSIDVIEKPVGGRTIVLKFQK